MKNFFDVFPTLKLGDELNSLVTDTFVEKITTTSAKDRITVYLNSTHLIPKKNIYELEDIILRDIFGRRNLLVHIEENYRLSRQYTPENLWNNYKESMKEAGIPDWYIWSCKRISYMFPKAHAVAYVTMAYRIAYCKINYPLAYYAAYFAIRASAFSYEIMCRGANVLKQNFERLESIETLSPKEEDTIKDMRIVEEMYARGFEFMPIDIYRADARHFQVIDGKIMPSLSSIDGLGEKAADSLAEAAAQGKFLSKDDIRGRGKVPRTVVDKMQELGLLEGLPESNQLSLFDL